MHQSLGGTTRTWRRRVRVAISKRCWRRRNVPHEVQSGDCDKLAIDGDGPRCERARHKEERPLIRKLGHTPRSQRRCKCSPAMRHSLDSVGEAATGCGMVKMNSSSDPFKQIQSRLKADSTFNPVRTVPSPL